ncbi:uracil phosphoribosyltransferase, putative [Babesia ovata]|uniref:Uracil phosphoribosyltransferase, putative n=1 Tax=Babesia ovata TaxID=189622 RepID=A0A2H6KD48_9APIC|nr:uracil phosphoribosyltransferase, putative [Babesia ovata]GBE60889.1 uracil phosphoribosyltransferase, putative [Babesia ovata]
MTTDFALDRATLQRYDKMLESWQTIQQNVDSNLRALVILLDKFLLFVGADDVELDEQDSMVDRLINSYADRIDKTTEVPVAYHEAMDRLAAVAAASQNDVSAASPLVANIKANLPGAIPLFLQRQSDKMLQIMSEISTECSTFQAGTLPKMELVFDAAVVHINRNSTYLQLPAETAVVADSVYRSFMEITQEIQALRDLVASMDAYPVSQQQIQGYIEQINAFKLASIGEYRKIIVDD